MDMRGVTADGRIRIGSRVFVRTTAITHPDYWDTVRGVFDQTLLLEPYARNTTDEALVLTEHSWCFVSEVLEVSDG